MHPHVPSLTTPPPPPHNRVQNKHVKIFHRVRVLCLSTVQRVLKTHSDSRKLDWTRLGWCEYPFTIESDWTGLDSTRLCWCVRTHSQLTSVKRDVLTNVFAVFVRHTELSHITQHRILRHMSQKIISLYIYNRKYKWHHKLAF